MDLREHKDEDTFSLQTGLFVKHAVRKTLASAYIILRHQQSAT